MREKALLSSLQDVMLGLSAAGELFTLSYISHEDKFIPVGRSYDGNSWEMVEPLLMNFDCTYESWCAVSLPTDETGGQYKLQRFDNTASSEAEIQRFLTQASFGPTRDTIIEVTATGIRDWIDSQMSSVAPTSHREYYRKRANPYAPNAGGTGNSGGVWKPCEVGSRWRRYAFGTEDRGKTLNVSSIADGRYSLNIDGVARTEIDYFNLSLDGPFTLCEISHQVDGDVTYGPDCEYEMTNPAVVFDSTDPVLSFATFTAVPLPAIDAVVLTVAPVDCDLAPAGATFLKDATEPSVIYIHDSRYRILESTVKNPCTIGATPQLTCPEIPKTFLNKDSCVAAVKSLDYIEYASAHFTLNETSLRQWYTLSNLVVYYISGLRLGELGDDDYPCSGRSRWMSGSTDCTVDLTTDLDSAAKDAIISALRAAGDANPILRDINLSNNKSVCEDDTSIPYGATVAFTDTDGDEVTCFEHVHPNLYDVYDWSYHSVIHSGNYDYFLEHMRNPILEAAEEYGDVELKFPSWHDMDRFEDAEKTRIGRLGDTVDFKNLDPSVQTEEMANWLGAEGSRLGTPYMEACGSPGEVANDNALGNDFIIFNSAEEDHLTQPSYMDRQYGHTVGEKIVWTMQALKAPDQLRQRVAWALSQLFVIGQDAFGNYDSRSEAFQNYYDVFVRHAFGNMRDIIREVSYSPMMGEYLTYINSRSMAYWHELYGGENVYPDENYARELNELFTIGLEKVYKNGTRVVDDGEVAETYTNDDVMTFARAWTGFEQQDIRKNYEDHLTNPGNDIDPMKINGDYRDPFPKMTLAKDYIGDQYPTCANLPKRAFLRKGARYNFLGSSPLPEYNTDLDEYAKDKAEITRLVLNNEGSELFALLCNNGTSQSTGKWCNFSSEVTLEENLPCDGMECDVDIVRVVRLNHPTEKNHTAWYEYIRVPCVELTFVEDAQEVANQYNARQSCADPRLNSNVGGVCSKSGYWWQVMAECKYYGERMSYATLEGRCDAKTDDGIGNDGWFEVIDWTWINVAYPLCTTGYMDLNMVYWKPIPCNIQVQVAQTGFIAVVHDTSIPEKVKDGLRVSSENWFEAIWSEDSYPTTESGCGRGEFCEALEDFTCLCNVTVNSSVVFTSSASMPTYDEITTQLHIGSPDPNMFDIGIYTTCEVCSSDLNVRVHVTDAADQGDEQVFDAGTIFEVNTTAGVKYLANTAEYVRIGGGPYSFRNPPHFMNFNKPETRDAVYETEAVIDAHLYNSNHPPFFCKEMIQHLVSSNPSPRYVETVVSAYINGSYDKFGSGKYGDLAATFAAIYLDREARATVLDHDPTFGLIREPLIKVIHFMRAMEFVPTDERPVILYDMETKIGMMAHDSPSVFNFYEPQYTPDGVVADAGLVAPEAKLLSPHLTVGWLNGLLSLVNWGLTNCWNGFGSATYGWDGCWSVQNWDGLLYKEADGYLNFSAQTSSRVIDELNLLLTGERLNEKGYAIIKNAYENVLQTGSEADALKAAQKLFFFAPEFSTTNENLLSGEERDFSPTAAPTSGPTETSERASDYKAIVYVMLIAGVDSYNLLVPHSDCGSKDMYEEYATVRGDVAFAQDDLLQISVPEGSQPCNTFGLHPSLTAVKDLYDAGDAAWIANIGALVEPLTADEYNSGTKETPNSLFAHFAQQKCAMNLEANDLSAKGALGRMADALTKQGFSTASYSVNGDAKVLENEGVANTYDIVTSDGNVKIFDSWGTSTELRPHIENLTGTVSTSIFAETWATSVQTSLMRTELLQSAISSVELEQTFAAAGSTLGQQLSTVAKLIKSNKEGNREISMKSERDAFYVSLGGFDTHSNVFDTLESLMDDVDASIDSFAQEMKLQGLWNNVTIITASDFGRTLTSNGAGTDHGWGGNHMVLGGSVRGGTILGEYPEDLTDGGGINAGRGRLVPTTSWEALFQGLSEWFGVDDSKMDNVLPNRINFGDSLFTQNDLFQTPPDQTGAPTPLPSTSPAPTL